MNEIPSWAVMLWGWLILTTLVVIALEIGKITSAVQEIRNRLRNSN